VEIIDQSRESGAVMRVHGILSIAPNFRHH
jgi:hypothetical protein